MSKLPEDFPLPQSSPATGKENKVTTIDLGGGISTSKGTADTHPAKRDMSIGIPPIKSTVASAVEIVKSTIFGTPASDSKSSATLNQDQGKHGKGNSDDSYAITDSFSNLRVVSPEGDMKAFKFGLGGKDDEATSEQHKRLNLLAGYPGQCCRKYTPFVGKPRGQIITIDEMEVYVVRPPPQKANGHAIIYMVDAYGIYKNAQLLADQFADAGYIVYMPDILLGDILTDDIAIPVWLVSQTHERIEPRIEKAIQFMGHTETFDSLGIVGYCFGGRYAARFMDGKRRRGLEPQIKAGFIAHPSFVTKEELEAIGAPLSIAAAEIDPIFPPEHRLAAEESLTKTAQPYQINLYSGVEHGFAVKGARNVGTIRFAQDQAFWQALAWFDHWLKPCFERYDGIAYKQAEEA